MSSFQLVVAQETGTIAANAERAGVNALQPHYELIKKENVSAKKSVVLVKDEDGSFVDGPAARAQLGLGSAPAAVLPGQVPAGFSAFIATTSSNRKMAAGSRFIVRTAAGRDGFVAGIGGGGKRKKDETGSTAGGSVADPKRSKVTREPKAFQLIVTQETGTIAANAERAGVNALQPHYELIKKENVSAKKSVVLVKDEDGSFVDGPAARAQLGLGSAPAAVLPGQVPAGFSAFIATTSSNRKMAAGSRFIVRTAAGRDGFVAGIGGGGGGDRIPAAADRAVIPPILIRADVPDDPHLRAAAEAIPATELAVALRKELQSPMLLTVQGLAVFRAVVASLASKLAEAPKGRTKASAPATKPPSRTDVDAEEDEEDPWDRLKPAVGAMLDHLHIPPADHRACGEELLALVRRTGHVISQAYETELGYTDGQNTTVLSRDITPEAFAMLERTAPDWWGTFGHAVLTARHWPGLPPSTLMDAALLLMHRRWWAANQLEPPASQRALKEAEARLGCVLPADLRQFLSVHNGWGTKPFSGHEANHHVAVRPVEELRPAELFLSEDTDNLEELADYEPEGTHLFAYIKRTYGVDLADFDSFDTADNLFIEVSLERAVINLHKASGRILYSTTCLDEEGSLFHPDCENREFPSLAAYLLHYAVDHESWEEEY